MTQWQVFSARHNEQVIDMMMRVFVILEAVAGSSCVPWLKNGRFLLLPEPWTVGASVS